VKLKDIKHTGEKDLKAREKKEGQGWCNLCLGY